MSAEPPEYLTVRFQAIQLHCHPKTIKTTLNSHLVMLGDILSFFFTQQWGGGVKQLTDVAQYACEPFSIFKL